MKEYTSEALKIIHQDAEGLHRLGIIKDDEMKEYDDGCLVKETKTVYETENELAEQLIHAAV